MAGDRFGVWDRAAVPIFDEPRRARRAESLVARGVVEAAQERDLLYQELAEKDAELCVLRERGDVWQEQALAAQARLDHMQQDHWAQIATIEQQARAQRDDQHKLATRIMDLADELVATLEIYADEWHWDVYPAGEHDRIVFVYESETRGWQLARQRLRATESLRERLEARLTTARDEEVPF
jgi:hypothetical protein